MFLKQCISRIVRFGNLFMSETISPNNGFEYLIDNSFISIVYESFPQSTNSVDNAVHKARIFHKLHSFIDQSSLCLFFKHCIGKLMRLQNIW